MKQKKERCKYCGEKMEAKTTRAEFCSKKCKVYWHRENPKVTLKNFKSNTTGTGKTDTEEKKKSQKEMPSGLDKGQMLRWHRENS